MDKILEAIKSMKVGDYIVIILNIIIVLFVLILVIKKIKNNRRYNCDEKQIIWPGFAKNNIYDFDYSDSLHRIFENPI